MNGWSITNCLSFFQTVLPNAFSWKKIIQFVYHSSWFLRVHFIVTPYEQWLFKSSAIPAFVQQFAKKTLNLHSMNGIHRWPIGHQRIPSQRARNTKSIFIPWRQNGELIISMVNHSISFLCLYYHSEYITVIHLPIPFSVVSLVLRQWSDQVIQKDMG